MVTKESEVTLVLKEEELTKYRKLSNEISDTQLSNLFKHLYSSSKELAEIIQGLSTEQKEKFQQELASSSNLLSEVKEEGTVSEPEYLSTNDVSKLLGISPQSVRKWCELKKLKAERTLGDFGEWKINIDQFKHSNEMEKKYWDLIKLKNEKQNKTHKALKEIELDSAEYREFINERI